MEHANKKRDWGKLISYILVVLLTAECILLILQNRDLKHMLSTMTTVGQVEPLKPGEKVEPFQVTTLDGHTNEFTFADSTRKYLLFVLSTTCPHCEKTLPIWKSIVKNKSDNCNVLGISIHNLDETKKFLASKDVGFYTVSSMSDTSFSRKYKISGVPETILINGNGTVEKAWVGELTSDQSNEIQALMNAPPSYTN